MCRKILSRDGELCGDDIRIVPGSAIIHGVLTTLQSLRRASLYCSGPELECLATGPIGWATLNSDSLETPNPNLEIVTYITKEWGNRESNWALGYYDQAPQPVCG
jgi:hypothetical protein